MNFFEEERLSGVSHPSLSNPIPRFLNFGNWEDDQDDSPKYAAQAFRLVSRTIEQNLPIFHTILAGSQTPCSPSPLHANKKTSLQFREPRKTLNTQEMIDTRCKLEEMMDQTTFYVLADIPGRPTRGMTSVCPGRNMSTLPGSGCSIGISSRLFEPLMRREVMENPLLSTHYNFMVATTILHELAHAAVYAATPQDMGDNVIGGDGYIGCSSSCSEIGFDMENRLWGGIPSTRITRHTTNGKQDVDLEHICYSTSENHKFRSAMVLRDWPDAFPVHAYGDLVTVRREGKSIHNIWRVSFNWLQQLFRDDFWESLRSGSYDQDALKMPKTLGMPEHDIRDWSVDKQAAKLAVKSILPPGYMWTADLTIKPRSQSGDLIESLRNASRVLRALLEQRFELLV